MALNCGFHIPGELGINDCRGILGKEGDAIGNGSPDERTCQDYVDGMSTAFDYNFLARANASKESREIIRSFFLRDSYHMPGHGPIIHP